jgi:hypothetical protein
LLIHDLCFSGHFRFWNLDGSKGSEKKQEMGFQQIVRCWGLFWEEFWPTQVPFPFFQKNEPHIVRMSGDRRWGNIKISLCNYKRFLSAKNESGGILQVPLIPKTKKMMKILRIILFTVGIISLIGFFMGYSHQIFIVLLSFGLYFLTKNDTLYE